MIGAYSEAHMHCVYPVPSAVLSLDGLFNPHSTRSTSLSSVVIPVLQKRMENEGVGLPEPKFVHKLLHKKN